MRDLIECTDFLQQAMITPFRRERNAIGKQQLHPSHDTFSKQYSPPALLLAEIYPGGDLKPHV